MAIVAEGKFYLILTTLSGHKPNYAKVCNLDQLMTILSRILYNCQQEDNSELDLDTY